jgi:hypothetical protein
VHISLARVFERIEAQAQFKVAKHSDPYEELTECVLPELSLTRESVSSFHLNPAWRDD